MAHYDPRRRGNENIYGVRSLVNILLFFHFFENFNMTLHHGAVRESAITGGRGWSIDRHLKITVETVDCVTAP